MFKFNVEVTTNKLMTKTKGRLIDVYENNDADYIAVASTLDIKHSTCSTVISIVANYLCTGRRGKLAKEGYRRCV